MSMAEHPLAHILVAVINARERDATRVSRLLHDDVSQILSAVGLQLDLARSDVEAQSPDVAKRIGECQKHLEEAIGQLRKLTYELNPALVERAGLQTALDRLVGRYRGQHASIRLLYDSSVRLPAKPATAIYKIIECALHNAAAHSDCRLIQVLVRATRDGVTVEVRDDGKGFDQNETQPGLGLLLMQYYASQNDLSFEIQTAPGQGTIVKTRYISQ